MKKKNSRGGLVGHIIYERSVFKTVIDLLVKVVLPCVILALLFFVATSFGERPITILIALIV